MWMVVHLRPTTQSDLKGEVKFFHAYDLQNAYLVLWYVPVPGVYNYTKEAFHTEHTRLYIVAQWLLNMWILIWT